MKWIKNNCRELLLVIIVFPSVIHVDAAAGKVAPFVLSPQVTELMANYCFDCHDADTQKGDIRLDNLGSLALKDRLDLLNKAQEQLFLKSMPPPCKADCLPLR